uniref:Protease n=1 Tax=viral metagenome TaxID=1070528 RepID=A0A6C0J1W0_9ZZZZ
MYKHMDDDSEEGVVSTMSEKISVLGNHIYFYTEVTKKTALELIKNIKELANNIMTLEIHNGKDSLYDDDKITYNPIYLHINSGGGCLFSCMSIIDTIKKCKVPVYTIGEGQIASAASIMLLSGKKRFMTENSFILIHELRTYVSGTYSNLEDDYENSKLLMKKMIKYYKKNSNIPESVLQTLLKKDIYIEAKKSKKYGLIDKIV